MADLTTAFNALLKDHEAAPTRRFSVDTADEFLKEAYRIVSRFVLPHRFAFSMPNTSFPELSRYPIAHRASQLAPGLPLDRRPTQDAPPHRKPKYAVAARIPHGSRP
jgi:hypothetical protein